MLSFCEPRTIIKTITIYDSAKNYHNLKDHIINYLRIPKYIGWSIDPNYVSRTNGDDLNGKKNGFSVLSHTW